MLRLLLLATVLMLSACAPVEPPGTRPAAQDLIRYHDDQSGVTCWKVERWDGLSCLPDSQLKPREQAGLGQPKSRHPRSTREILSQYAGQDVAAQPEERIRL